MEGREDLSYTNMLSLTYLYRALNMADMDCHWHSLVFWAYQCTAATVGMQLGFDRMPPIQWLGQQGMLWSQLMLTMYEALKYRSQPDILVLQLSKNDLVACSAVQLQDNRDIDKICQLMPGSRLVWADMLPRCIWHGTHSHKAIDFGQKKGEQTGRQDSMQELLGCYCPACHSAWASHICWSDRVDLSLERCDIDLANMARGISAVIAVFVGKGCV